MAPSPDRPADVMPLKEQAYVGHSMKTPHKSYTEIYTLGIEAVMTTRIGCTLLQAGAHDMNSNL